MRSFKTQNKTVVKTEWNRTTTKIMPLEYIHTLYCGKNISFLSCTAKEFGFQNLTYKKLGKTLELYKWSLLAL